MSNTAISTSRTVLAALYDDIDLEDAATTFAVSDNCNVVKINNIVIRWLVSSYVADTLPNGVTLGAAGFSEDFSILVTNSGIYSYNTSDDSYKLARTETYHTTKSVWRDNNKLVIFSYKPSSVAGVFDFKLETNILHPT